MQPDTAPSKVAGHGRCWCRPQPSGGSQRGAGRRCRGTGLQMTILTPRCVRWLIFAWLGCALDPQIVEILERTLSVSFARDAAVASQRESSRLGVDCRTWSLSKVCSRGTSSANAGQNTHLDIHRSSSPITLAVQGFIKLSVYPSLPIQMQISRSSPPCTECAKPFQTLQCIMPAPHCIANMLTISYPQCFQHSSAIAFRRQRSRKREHVIIDPCSRGNRSRNAIGYRRRSGGGGGDCL